MERSTIAAVATFTCTRLPECHQRNAARGLLLPSPNWQKRVLWVADTRRSVLIDFWHASEAALGIPTDACNPDALRLWTNPISPGAQSAVRALPSSAQNTGLASSTVESKTLGPKALTEKQELPYHYAYFWRFQSYSIQWDSCLFRRNSVRLAWLLH